MPTRYEIRLSGSGGQGLILAGKILAEAAVIYDKKNATQSQSYGPEARGGASRSEVVISDGDIIFPKAQNIDFLLSLTQKACDKYCNDLKDGGILLIDSKFVKRIPDGNYRRFSLPIIDIAKDEVGRTITANIVALGLITELSGVLSRKAVELALVDMVPKGTEEINKKAFMIGIRKAEELKKAE
ncbi:MAG: 2-oxoglutarate ferredoxin oxidoreductase subunit gamma [Candidatus Cloacimonas sp. 4484_209]|nr:MAG: 2-oxoglutarate ferredoxin oxidoreductase subunit gamma [Candidatus Cloacimonas sp. 4484_209]